MDKLKTTVGNLRERMELGLRRLCGRISPNARVWVIVAMFILFGCGSIWMTVSSIYRFGRESGRTLEIERIETLRLQSTPQRDSINVKNQFENERTTNE
jgi:hypothetical protein